MMYFKNSQMSPSPPLLLLFLLISTTTTTTFSTSDILSSLSHLHSTSPSSLIPLSTPLLDQILSLPLPRPFHFIVFFDAVQLHHKTELQLPTLKSEFALLAKSLNINSPPSPSSPSPIFFFHAEYKENREIFTLFGVDSIPYIKLVPPSIPRTNIVKGSIRMEPRDYSRLADSMSEFIEAKANISIGVIHRPPLLSKTQTWVVFGMILFSMPVLIKKIMKGDTLLHSGCFWAVVITFVYFFSVSGTMHNIIRKMPMYMGDKHDPNKVVFFYKGPRTQLGIEGFSVGFLYTIVGLLLALLTHGLGRVKSVNVQRFVMIGALFLAFWAVATVIGLDNWKTGYHVHTYWPTSWVN